MCCECCGMCYPDSEKQNLGCVLLHYQCGCGPCKCCDYDDNGMCWGCICCQYQVDPCWLPRNITHCCCAVVPCGCISKEIIFFLCCCNPGRSKADPHVMKEEAEKRAAEMVAEDKAKEANKNQA